jgi:hypothetical protein
MFNKPAYMVFRKVHHGVNIGVVGSGLPSLSATDTGSTRYLLLDFSPTTGIKTDNSVTWYAQASELYSAKFEVQHYLIGYTQLLMIIVAVVVGATLAVIIAKRRRSIVPKA